MFKVQSIGMSAVHPDKGIVHARTNNTANVRLIGFETLADPRCIRRGIASIKSNTIISLCYCCIVNSLAET